MLGTKLKIETLDKRILEINIPPCFNTDMVLEHKHEGMMYDNYVGDLYIKVKLKIPKNISKDEKELLGKIKELKNSTN
jgi:DnaJ-class molecular chaperone